MSRNLNKPSMLCNREDLIDYLRTMLPDPFNYHDVNGATYQREIRELEYVSRPLWAIFSLIASEEYDEKMVQPYMERIKLGLRPNTKWSFIKPTTKTRQIAVEMAVYGYGLLICKNRFLKYLNETEIVYLEDWLNSINEIQLPMNNWQLFIMMVNCGLKKNNLRYSQEKINEAKEKINNLYVGDGWYQDGNNSQRDYYIAFGFHFYSMILCKFTDELDREKVKKRCFKFQNDFIYWIDQQGRTLQFGRSLSYRFGHVAFWVGQVIGDCYSYHLGEIKELIFRNLNYWLEAPILQDKMLTVGCGYPNLLISEDYSALGSPAWALKTFTLLMLPSVHQFWQAAFEKKDRLKKISCQKGPGFLIVTGLKHHYALSAFQFSKGHILQHCSKYGKFCYSTRFGWNLSRDVQEIENFAVDSTLALSIKGTSQYVSRSEIQDHTISENYLYSVWNYGKIAKIESWLIPIDEVYHIRIHRIDTMLDLQTYEGAFPVLGWHYKFNQPILQEDGVILKNRNIASGIRCLFKNRRPVVVKQNPNTNIYDHETNGVACLYGEIKKGVSVIGCLVYGDFDVYAPTIAKKIKFENNVIEFNNKKIYLKEF